MGDDMEKRQSGFARIGFGLAVLSVLAMVAAALGYRWGLWDYPFALLKLTKYATYGALAAAAISLVGVGRSWPGGPARGLLMSIAGVVIGAAAFQVVYEEWKLVQTMPFIHDITTDTENPPAFVAIVPLREAAQAKNPYEYGGPELAAKQRYGGFNEPYKDLGPYLTDLPPDQVFGKALAAAQGMGWEIIDSDPAAGRIEATEASFWYGFADDIVIRVAATDQGSRIDMRSVSRVGHSDLGVNAKRIRAYMAALAKQFG